MKLTPQDIEDFYGQYIDFESATRVTQPDGSVELTTCCPFHDDSKASLSVNLKKGIYKCHTQSCPQSGGGTIYRFYSALKDVDENSARETINGIYRKEGTIPKNFPYTEEGVRNLHSALLRTKPIVDFLHKECLYTENTISEFELGWDGSRIIIPIRENGNIVNVRKYGPKSEGGKVIGVRGFNTSHVWPQESLDSDTIYLMEGEKDCMLANQLGLPAITVTGGAGTFKPEWRKFFEDKHVNICYDIDQAGKDGADRVSKAISGVAKSVKIIELPITEPANADFTDYILQKNTIQDFQDIADNTVAITHREESYVEISDEVKVASLEDATYLSSYFCRLRTKVRVLGKSMTPYIIPKEVVVSCTAGVGAKCSSCGLTGHKKNTATVILDETRPELLAFLNCSSSQQRMILHKSLKIAGQCNQFSVMQTKHQYVEEITVIPYIDEQTFDAEYIRRDIFVINRRVDANRDYELEMLTVPDPRTQSLVHVAYKAVPCETSIEEFEMTPEMYEKLRIFQCQSIKLEEESTTSTQT